MRKHKFMVVAAMWGVLGVHTVLQGQAVEAKSLEQTETRQYMGQNEAVPNSSKAIGSETRTPLVTAKTANNKSSVMAASHQSLSSTKESTKESTKDLTTKEDTFYWIGQINKASIIINGEEGLLDKKFQKPFAKGLEKVLQAGNSGGPRPQNVITFEPYLIEAAGPEVTRIHAGRSSQDMLTSARMMLLRKDLLDLGTAVTEVNRTLLRMAAEQQDTILPAYTNGVAAQPTSFGHYLEAFNEGFQRDMIRIENFYHNVNRSPMGATVLNGTSWPLNRDRMANYLGFAELAYNTYDATQIYTLEYPAEAAAVTTSIALHVGNFVEDIMQQYAQPQPWILLKEGGANTYVSSAMPQKRNPGILNAVRTEASTLLGEAVGAVIRAHNIPPGMADSRSSETNQMLRRTTKMLHTFTEMLGALQINANRAYEELNLDWTASQEIADVLMRKYNVPFRIGHHVASEMVSYGRAHAIKPLDFPYAVAQEIYAKELSAVAVPEAPKVFPMSETEFKETLNPRAIVLHRAVKGGPQPVEMQKMLMAANRNVQAQAAWLQAQKDRLKAANDQLNADFEKLLE